MVKQLMSSVEKLRIRSEHGQTKSRKSLFTCDHEEGVITTFDHDNLAYTLKEKQKFKLKRKTQRK